MSNHLSTPASAGSHAPISNPSRIEWHWSTFAALTPHALYAILAARSAVFVIEQQCIYADIDGLDPLAWHLYGQDAAQPDTPLAACARVFAPDADDRTVRIGRVVSTSAYRGQGLGKALLEQAMLRIAEQWPQAPLRLHAQAYLQAFYAGFGFEACSDVHLEDDIPHIWMQRPSIAVQPYRAGARLG